VRSAPERDASVERLLRQTLRVPGDAPLTGACLDPETLAAWADGGLSGPPLELAQSHVTGCPRCQTLLGTLTRIHTAVPTPPAERASPRWLPWFVPLTAAAVGIIAVSLWISLPRNAVVPLPQPMQERTQEAGKQAPAPAAPDERSNVAPSAPSQVGSAVDGISAGEPQPSVAGGREVEAKADSQIGAAKQEESRRDTARLEADSAKAQSAPAPAPPQAAPPPAADRAGAVMNRSATEASVVEIVSPDPAVRWRINRSTVQRSSNGGSSWSTISIGFQGQLTAGSAPSASVCWLVGGGMVLLSTDGGASWRRVAFPEPANLSAIRATDARTALVTTADGRTFRTNDGGLTWVLSAPQGF